MSLNKSKVGEWMINISCLVGVLGIVASLIYFFFIKDSIIEQRLIDESVSSIEVYTKSPSNEHLSIAIFKHSECYSAIKFDYACLPDHREEFLKLLIDNGDIDTVLGKDVFFRSLGLMDGMIYQHLMANYTGNEKIGLFLKADALARQGDVKPALPIYKELFLEGNHYQVAVRLRGLLSYYGCHPDYEVWGEFTEQFSQSVRPHGSPYPAQESSLPVPELVNRRIMLRNGEFVPFMPECPLSRLTK